jgi:LuxR family maltose regulon positive regulatory protein
MGILFGKLAAAPTAAVVDVPRPYLDRLATAFERAGVTVVTGAAWQPGLIAPLTSRELEVLALLAAGKTNQMIANDLVISLDTVKRHVTHIFDKLGVANRTQAAARARELGLRS